MTEVDCVGPECSRFGEVRGLCNSHYEQSRRLSELKPLRAWGSSLIRDETGRKLCWSCKSWFPEGDFGPHKSSKDGLRTDCKSCRSSYYKTNRSSIRSRNFLLKYGISLEQRNEILAEQGGVCATCGTSDPGPHDWSMDHDHSCCPGAGLSCSRCLRGVLCSSCNLILGQVKDDPIILQRMIDYLERHK